MSYYLTSEMARAAFEVIAPALVHFLDSSLPKRPCLHLVVMDPAKRYETTTPEEAILFEQSINRAAWGDYDFGAYARAKAFLSYRTGLSSLEVQQFRPHLYIPGDVKYGGGVVFNGIVAAASAIQPYFDAMCAMWLATTCHALAIHGFQPLLTSEEAWVPST